MMKYFLSAFLWTVLACSREKQPEPIPLSDRQVALHSIGNAVIIRNLLDLQNSVNGLNEFASSYTYDSTDTKKLHALRKEWVNTVVSWKLASVFLEGSFSAEIKSSNLYAPADTASIENIIVSKTQPFDPGYMQSLGETSTGLAAMEYLIYGISFKDTESVISAFRGLGSRRGAYLRALCLDLKRRSDLLLYQWSMAGNGYINKFMDASGLERKSSVGILADNMIATISKVKDDRIGAPLGVNGIARPELVESRYGRESITFIQAELQSVQQTFTGTRTVTTGVKGFYWLLDQAQAKSGNAMLSTAIKAQFDDNYSKLSQIKVTLEEAVVADSEQVEELYESVSKLQKLLQDDMVASLHFHE
ncbi:hypothetical protein LXM25_09940 [Dyadobacter sp. LJ53]|uniref:imelysin family protein n=1 Tax=Dyadobacter chenwenxiniae TaxID=2906456 RepID=UPI001F22B13C|nr:imelysin family protein [Dyadobacter chenwenxiniae]MCF0050378.1 hypothetical protein [Dyadobacter chenwenxiniae]